MGLPQDSASTAAAASVLLPTAVRPKKYTLTLEPDFETFKFKGSVAIDLDVVEPTSEIVFHSHELEILSAVVEAAGGKQLMAGQGGVSEVNFDRERATATLHLGQDKLEVGSAKLHIQFVGTHNDNMIGFYRSSYVREGEKEWMVTTQFEPAGARQALPCWDEPAAKATFAVTLVVPPNLQGLSNMPVVASKKRDDGSTVVTYADTPVMSTYLLAFVVGDLEHISDKTAAGTEVNIYTVPGKKEQGKFALHVACKVLDFFTNYFGIAYPLPKADFIAVPDFSHGAMENWGLITFRETFLLVDDANAPATTKQRVADCVSHELAHQWFGNLVTMKWWTDLWLNEGFATWVGYLGVDHVFPHWDIWTQFVSDELSTAMETDALLTSHPVEVPINDPKEIEQVFDSLSYSKGAAVIRQLEAAIGSEAFKKGLHSYLTKHAYANTTTRDLWDALEAASGKPVAKMMASWTSQMGYPLITVTDADKGLKLRQSRFLSKGPPSPEEDTQLWYVGVTAATGTPQSAELTPLPTFVLTEKEAVADAFAAPEGGWIRLNAGQTGIYRVNYTAPQWAALAKAVEEVKLPVIDRLGLAMDAFALAKAGVIPTTQALDLASAYSSETDYTVWSQLAGDLAELDILVSALGERPALEAAGLKLFQPIASKLGWEPKEGEVHTHAMLRPMALGRLASFGDPTTVAECRRLFAAMQRDRTAVSPDLRLMVMATAVRNGGRDELDAVKKMYRDAAAPDFKMHCLVAMGRSKEEAIFKEFLDWGLNEDNVKAQDQIYVFRAMSANADNRAFAWEYFKQHYESIHKRFLPAPSMFMSIPASPLREFATNDKADDAEEFYAANPVPEAAMELQRTLEGIRSRASWLERDGSAIVAWLKARA